MKERSPRGGECMDRRSFLACGAGGLVALAARGAQAQALRSRGSVVETTAGKVAGLANGPVRIFKGIHYGAPTGGANRFMPPQKPVPWSGVREATQIGPRCPQPPTPGLMREEAIDLDYGPMSEDCLSLNVWTAADAAAKRPVMVWFHGGGYAVGSGGSVRYDGSNLARKHEVVVVTVNHRLNAFGFLDLSSLGGAKFADSGNVGMLDIVAALEWVRDNIANFGGDPGNVTVFGESGGGGKVSTLMAMPASKALFHRALAHCRHPFDPEPPEISATVPMLLGSNLTERTFFPDTPLDPIDDAALLGHVKRYTGLGDAEASRLIAPYRQNRANADNTFLYQLLSADCSMTAHVTPHAH